jgi:hypothetical protein
MFGILVGNSALSINERVFIDVTECSPVVSAFQARQIYQDHAIIHVWTGNDNPKMRIFGCVKEGVPRLDWHSYALGYRDRNA